MRKSLDSHYVNNLLRRDWRIKPREYQTTTHSITEKDIIRIQETHYTNSVLYTIYCNLSAGSNNFYDYILEKWGPVWEGDDVRIAIVPTLPNVSYIGIEVNNPDGDDILGDYNYRIEIKINSDQGPFIVCEDGSSAYFAPNYVMMTRTSTYIVNFNGIWVINPGEL